MTKTFKIKQQYKSFVFLINGKINEYICLASVASLYTVCRRAVTPVTMIGRGEGII